ncbi:hypothetical protein [Nocardia cyriacigeorgica]|uniref:hypothetical protein n=1 Tax=Nocardia cyriacigeorgica TaxID=135487 RepID=UPI002453AAD9|nr:hypothetical protein [Nocardia cyriacigeorgica]
MPDHAPAPLTDDELREIANTADAEMLPDETVRAMATELLAARAEIGALRNDLDAKSSDFDAACRHLGESRARVAFLEDQAAVLTDAETERARLSLYARNARRTIRTLWESRRRWQTRVAELKAERDGMLEVAEHRLEVIREMAAEIAADSDRIAQLEAERDAARQVMTDHRCGDQAELAYRRAATAEARVAELEAAQAEARRIHDESPGECYHCPRCQDAVESQREAARIAELELREVSDRG